MGTLQHGLSSNLRQLSQEAQLIVTSDETTDEQLDMPIVISDDTPEAAVSVTYDELSTQDNSSTSVVTIDELHRNVTTRFFQGSRRPIRTSYPTPG